MGEKTGPNPTDRAKRGTNRSLLVDGRGTPLSVVVAGANRNDHLLMDETLQALPVDRPQPTPDQPQHLCLDKGYDYAEPRDLAEAFFTLRLRTRGEETAGKREAGKKARRWVVERTHSWLNRFRRILIRWDRKAKTISLCSTSPAPSSCGGRPYRDDLLARLTRTPYRTLQNYFPGKTEMAAPVFPRPCQHLGLDPMYVGNQIFKIDQIAPRRALLDNVGHGLPPHQCRNDDSMGLKPYVGPTL